MSEMWSLLYHGIELLITFVELGGGHIKLQSLPNHGKDSVLSVSIGHYDWLPNIGHLFFFCSWPRFNGRTKREAALQPQKDPAASYVDNRSGAGWTTGTHGSDASWSWSVPRDHFYGYHQSSALSNRHPSRPSISRHQPNWPTVSSGAQENMHNRRHATTGNQPQDAARRVADGETSAGGAANNVIRALLLRRPTPGRTICTNAASDSGTRLRLIRQQTAPDPSSAYEYVILCLGFYVPSKLFIFRPFQISN